jgi:uncharacterized protein (UPF0335 family)
VSLEDVKSLAAQQRGEVAHALRWAIQQIESLQREKDDLVQEIAVCSAHVAMKL